MRIVIELKKDANPDIVLNQLYKLTPMQESFGIIMLAIVDNRPKLLTLKDALQVFIGHRKEVVTRRTVFELRKAEERLHILDGLKIALDHLDAVIKLIRAAQIRPPPRPAWCSSSSSPRSRPRRSSTCACSASPASSATRSSKSTPRR